jgi:hypothetical protein
VRCPVPGEALKRPCSGAMQFSPLTVPRGDRNVAGPARLSALQPPFLTPIRASFERRLPGAAGAFVPAFERGLRTPI